MDVVAMVVLVGVVGAIILTPLFRRSGFVSLAGPGGSGGQTERKTADALADLALDHAMGKLADDDYAALRSTVAAAPAASAVPAALPADAVDPLEAEIRAARRLRRSCAGCSAALPPAARFCPACGAPAEGRG